MGAHRKPTPSTPDRVRAVARYTAVTAAAGLGVVVGIENSPAANAADLHPEAVTAALPQINWDPIIHCESGGNPQAQNSGSTASGLFQFLTSSWLAYGGGKYAPTAAQATVAQQYEIANAAYAASGLSPWAASQPCWGGQTSKILAGGGTTPPPAAAPAKAPAATAKHASNQPAPAAAPAATAPKHAAPAPVVHTPVVHTPVVTAAVTVDTSPIASGDYTVKAGDTLSMIAYRHGDNGWNGLYQRNQGVVGGNPNLILPGQHLTV